MVPAKMNLFYYTPGFPQRHHNHDVPAAPACRLDADADDYQLSPALSTLFSLRRDSFISKQEPLPGRNAVGARVLAGLEPAVEAAGVEALAARAAAQARQLAVGGLDDGIANQALFLACTQG
jgi:hypothetical protein